MENKLPVWVPLLTAVILGGSYIFGQHLTVEEQYDDDDITISVSGEGRAFANPDIASLNFGVQTGRQKTAEAAMEILAKNMKQVVAAVEGAGVEEKDINTQHLSLNPSYDWDEGKRRDQGFEASQSLRVKVRDLDAVSKVLGAATAAGANQAGGVSFTIDDPEEIREEAREKAIAQAKKKGKQLAKQLGKKLGDIKGFSEGGGYQPYPMMRSMAMDAMGGAVEEMAPPIPVGEQEVNVSVSITFELE